MAVNFLDGITIGGELTTTGGTNNITTTNASSSLYLLNLTRTSTSLTTAGNVGIGTTAPAQKLDVNGAVVTTDYYSSPNGPNGSNKGIHANVVIYTKFNTIYMTFRSGLLVGYDCDGEECPEQP